jgi:hypothetical protein
LSVHRAGFDFTCNSHTTTTGIFHTASLVVFIVLVAFLAIHLLVGIKKK